MKKKRWALIVAVVLLLIVVGPVVVTQLTATPARTLTGVSLAETDYREIRFDNRAQNIPLAGMLFIPQGEGPFPAVVFIHGSGGSRRENRWYLTLANHLQKQGIAVLLPDKRGSEQSGGDWRNASFEDLATDTLAAVEYLKGQEEVSISKIGLIGMSQGGHIAPVVATKSADVAFVVDVVGGARPMRDQLLYEENHNLRQMGFLPGISHSVAWLSTSYLVHVSQKDFWNAVGEFDPLPYWKQVNVPSLVLYGQADTNVNSTASAAILRNLRKPNLDVELYEESGHALEEPAESGNQIFRPDARERISEFIHTQCR